MLNPVANSVDFFFVSTKSWRNLDDVSVPLHLFCLSLEGVVYGLEEINEDCYMVASFDSKTVVFMEIICPNDVKFIHFAEIAFLYDAWKLQTIAVS